MKKVLELKNDISQVPLLGEWVECIGEEMLLPMPAVFQLNLALEEAVVNVMSYAYPDKKDMPVILEADANETEEVNSITFTLRDNGIPFDPTQSEEPDITLSAEERNIGGLGIFLVQQIMSEVNYERKDNSNILTMRYSVNRDIESMIPEE